MSQSPALNYPSTLGQKSLVRVGGGLGVAATSISMAIFVLGCFGFSAAFTWLPVLPFIMAIVGLLLTIIGAIWKKSAADEDTQIFISMFCNFLGLVGALVEIGVWLNWGFVYQGASGG